MRTKGCKTEGVMEDQKAIAFPQICDRVTYKYITSHILTQYLSITGCPYKRWIET